MPNRILKESICYSENIEKLTQFQENFFYRLIVNCDDYGRMDARPKVLASKLYPLKDIRLNQISDALHALTSAELITIYEENGHPFLQMNTWDRHQTIRAKKSKYPAPESKCMQMISDASNCMQMQADDFNCKQMISDASICSRNPIQSESESESISESESESEPAAQVPSLFDVFWSVYPKHEAKQAAKKAFDKLKPDEALVQTMVTAIEKWKQTDQWQENGGQFIPYPATWLNGRRWEDDVPEKRKAKAANKPVIAQQYTQRDYSQPADSSSYDDFMDRLSSLMK